MFEKLRWLWGRLTGSPEAPERERWLHGNREAGDSVRRGLQQLAAGDVSAGPDVSEDFEREFEDLIADVSEEDCF